MKQAYTLSKEEVIRIHFILAYIKDYLESDGRGKFPTYNALQITPYHNFRSKREHKHAIFTLGYELAKSVSGGPNETGISARLKKDAEETAK